MNEHKLLSLSDPLNSLRCAFNKCISCSHSLPKFLVGLILTCLKRIRHTRWSKDANLISRLCKFFKIVNGMFSVFYGKKCGQVGCVGWDPDKDTKPVATSKNATWGKYNWTWIHEMGTESCQSVCFVAAINFGYAVSLYEAFIEPRNLWKPIVASVPDHSKCLVPHLAQANHVFEVYLVATTNANASIKKVLFIW